MRRWLIVLGVSCALLAIPAKGSAQRAKKTVKIGIVVDGPWAFNKVWSAEFIDSITDLVGKDFKVEFPKDKQLVGDWTLAKAKQNLDTLMADPEVKLVLTMGALASQDAGTRPRLRKPVIAPFVLDQKLQGLPYRRGTSGRYNLNYLVLPWQFDRNIQAFKEVTPFTRLTVLSSNKYLVGIPQLRKRLLATAKAAKVQMTVVAVDDDVSKALAAIPKDTQAVYVAPILHLPIAEWDKLIAGVHKRKLPTFSHLGRFEVDRGVLVGLSPTSNRKRIARRVAVHVQRTLMGENPSKFRVVTKLQEQLAINMKTARQINVWPSWMVLTEAELVGWKRGGVQRNVSLESVAKQALDGNVDYRAAILVVKAGKQKVKIAKSNLLPQISANTQGVLIDRDRATSSFSNQNRFMWTAGGSISQVLYSERAWAGYTIEKHLQRSRRHDLQTKKLDTIVGAAIAYLNVLILKSIERIQGANLKTTRANLDIARTRKAVGFATNAEVYRWEAQIANDRKSVIEASANRNVAEIELNRILNRPLEENFRTADPSINSKSVLNAQRALFSHLNNPWSFKIFRRFLVKNGVAASPEIKAIDAALAAQRRFVKSTKRAYYAPTIGLQASLTHIVGRAGASSSGLDLGLPPGMGPEIRIPDDTNWQIGISLSIPLFAGGSRSAEVNQAKLETRRLQRQRTSLVQRIAQRIRGNAHQLGASYAAIRLAQQAANAANKNLKLVTNAYGRGVVRILDLIDAQNQANIAALRTATARYTFLINWINTQRAIGQFDFASSATDRAKFLRDLRAFTKANQPR